MRDVYKRQGVSRSHLYRVFMLNVGKSPIDYLTEYRINEACKLLRAGNLSIAEVAISVGFFDQFYFSRVFKRAKGCLLYTSYLTPEVKTMLAASGYPGMKIMQFAFASREPGNYLPYTYTPNSVVYTGTHDNVTTEGWRQSASPEDVHYACRYLRCLPEDLTEACLLYTSR